MYNPVEAIRNWHNQRVLVTASNRLVVQPEITLLDQVNASLPRRWTNGEQNQLSFLLCLRAYQNHLVEKATNQIDTGAWLTGETPNRLIKDQSARVSLLEFNASDKLWGVLGDSAGVVIAFAGNCYFDLHPELSSKQGVQ